MRRRPGASGGARSYRRVAAGVLMGMVAACGGIGSAAAPVRHGVMPPPASLRLDPFYAKYVDADGIPVIASARVPDDALQVARSLVADMLAHRPDLRRALVARGQRVAIMAQSEGTMDLPEQRGWKKPTPDDPRLTRCERKWYDQRIGRLTDAQYWNARARGMGGVLMSGSEEDLLGKHSSRYYGENIFVHEFSHVVLDAVQAADPALYRKVEAAYAHAMATGLWKDEYAGTTVQEYWAEGSQYWFNDNKLAAFGDVTVLSDADLKAYDPTLHALLGKVYGRSHHLASDWFYESPARVPVGPRPRVTAEQC